MISFLLPNNINIYNTSALFVGTIVGSLVVDGILQGIPGGKIAAPLIGTVIGLCSTKMVDRVIAAKNPVVLEKIVNKIVNCNATNELYRKAKFVLDQTYNADLKIKIEKNIPCGGCVSTNGEILISSELSESDALAVLIFELGNMSQFDKFKEIEDLASGGKIDRQEYTFRMESQELETSKIYTRTINAASQENDVDWITWNMHRWDNWVPDKLSLFFCKLTGHSSLYLKQFDELHGNQQ